MSELQSNVDTADTKAREQALLSATKAISRPQHSITISNPPWSALDDLMGQEEEVFEEAFIPPENFNMVSDHVYRSSFPKKKHFSFLKKLGLKSVLTLILEEYPEQNMKFLEENDIKFLQFGIAGNKVTTLLNIRMLSQRDD
ncbi:unnamed protein product [Umbelopsis vinacea]